MKVNIFVHTPNGGKFAGGFPHQTLTGTVGIGACDAGDEVIRAIDESRTHPTKVLAQRFLTFLGDRRLDMVKLKNLPIDRQQELRKEFLGE